MFQVKSIIVSSLPQQLLLIFPITSSITVTKVAVYTASCVSILLYGCEGWYQYCLSSFYSPWSFPYSLSARDPQATMVQHLHEVHNYAEATVTDWPRHQTAIQPHSTGMWPILGLQMAHAVPEACDVFHGSKPSALSQCNKMTLVYKVSVLVESTDNFKERQETQRSKYRWSGIHIDFCSFKLLARKSLCSSNMPIHG